MIDDPTIRAGVLGRAKVRDLVGNAPHEALKAARAISHPWYRCQALSGVAESWGTHTQKVELLEEALNAAQEQSEINRIVTVSSWPLRVMVGIAPEVVLEHLRRLVPLANGEPHTLRRADALSSLAFAIRSERFLLAEVGPSLAIALLNGRGWRIDRLIRKAVEILSDSMPDAAERLIAHHSETSKKRALLESLKK